MIDANIKKLIRSVKEITRFHLNNPSNEAMTSKNWDFIFEDFEEWVVLEVSTEGFGGYWMSSVLYPITKIEEVLDNFLHEKCSYNDSIAYSVVGNRDEFWLEPYWGENGNFDDSEVPLYFHRNYFGRPRGKEGYIEPNQLITHLLDLHWSTNKNSYCSMSNMGEEIEKMKIIDSDGVKLVLIRRSDLNRLMNLGKWGLARYFLFSRLLDDSIFGKGEIESKTVEFNKFKGRYRVQTLGKEKIQYSEFRGVKVQETESDDEHSYLLLDYEEKVDQYAGFIIYDLKNNKVIENYSIDPKNFSDYFIKNDLPYEISPIFFNAEVLDKYKDQPDKYNLEERSITCRGGWHLKTYDINEYNQVHTYAIYLSRLPYKEQLHWKQHNEKPNGEISERANQTDFMGQFSEPSELNTLRRELHDLGNIKLGDDIGPIWLPKGGSWQIASNGLFYLKTENTNQWHDFIIILSNTVIEGFRLDALKKIAKHYGYDEDQYKKKNAQPLRTLGLIKFILKTTDNEKIIPQIHSVLNDLQIKRAKGKAHGSWETPNGSLIENSEKLLKDVIAAVQKLRIIFESLNMAE